MQTLWQDLRRRTFAPKSEFQSLIFVRFTSFVFFIVFL
jgi:hypothetical protein